VSVRIALALAILLTAFGTPAGAVERILNFISDVTVERSGDLIVTETITVQAEGNQIRRGILRDFPTTYRRPDGARVEVGFDVQAVTRDGSPETFVVERLNNGYRIRIGSADRILDNGPHTYGIRYRTTRQIGFFPSYDEPHDKAFAARKWDDGRGGLAKGRRDGAKLGSGGALVARGQCCGADRHRRHHSAARLLLLCVDQGRPRSTEGHHYSIVRTAG
jgi:hypothetical protein